ncbi:MAG: O-antigen ligase protein [Acidimicrobiales bacterium]|nr:O-antigen ligase protein [Acidimicrobiales bacterium]
MTAVRQRAPAEHSYLWPFAIALLVVVCGALVVVQPLLALALAGAVVVVGLSKLPPDLLLLGVVGLTAIVPYGVQKSFGIGGSPGLLLSDVLLFAALTWAFPRLHHLHLRVHPRVRLSAVLIAAFVVLAGLQVVRGLLIGRDTSVVGYEFRVLLGYSTLLVTIPILADDRLRGRLLRGLPVLGLALGLWGIAQWFFNIQFSEAADAGVRAGVRLTSSGRGQLQGGLFAFPVAALLAMAASMSGVIRSLRVRILLAAVVVLNLVALVLTYERTFWVATAMAAAFVLLKAGRAQRWRAVIWGTAIVMVAFAALSTFAPNELTAARERLLSISQYGSDFSVLYRITESRHVAEAIRANPLAGAGLGATIFFGRPWDIVPPQAYGFSHNGYLWVPWRVGIPTAALLFVVFFWAMRLLRRPGSVGLFGAVQNGARGSLFALAFASITFPSFGQLGITATLGMLMAIGLWPDVGARPARSDDGALVAQA